jgi:hypothetical protein
VQIAQLEGWSVSRGSALDLYRFIDPAKVEPLRAMGVLPWFTAPALKISFWRPLSSALMQLDHALFGHHAVGYHLHTLLWYAGLLLVGAALFRRALPPAFATLALLVFCLDDGHATAAAWTAARNASVACTLVWLGLLAHLRWRCDGWRPGAVVAPMLAALGLCAGEMALGALAYLVAWEVVTRRRGWMRALAPTLAIVIGLRVVHHLAGFGARHSGTYSIRSAIRRGSSVRSPSASCSSSPTLLASAPLDLLIFEPRLRLPMLLAGVAMDAARCRVAQGRAPAHDGRGVARRALAGARRRGRDPGEHTALIGERVLLAASLGGAAILAALLRDAWRCGRRVLRVLGRGGDSRCPTWRWERWRCRRRRSSSGEWRRRRAAWRARRRSPRPSPRAWW